MLFQNISKRLKRLEDRNGEKNDVTEREGVVQDVGAEEVGAMEVGKEVVWVFEEPKV